MYIRLSLRYFRFENVSNRTIFNIASSLTVPIIIFFPYCRKKHNRISFNLIFFTFMHRFFGWDCQRRRKIHIVIFHAKRIEIIYTKEKDRSADNHNNLTLKILKINFFCIIQMLILLNFITQNDFTINFKFMLARKF